MPIIVLGLMWVSFFSYQPVSESKVAILIGCNKYSDRTLGDLQYAENDILTLELELKAAGYKTYVMIGSKVRSDVESNGASKVLELIKKTCGSGSVKRENIIVAFSGHGIQKMNNENMTKERIFYCPWDADTSINETMVDLSEVTTILGASNAKNCLVLYDACRNVIDLNRGIGAIKESIIKESTNVSVFFSCKSRQKSIESVRAGGGHGIFFNSVIETIKTARENGSPLSLNQFVNNVTSHISAELSSSNYKHLSVSEKQTPEHVISIGQSPENILILNKGVAFKKSFISPSTGLEFVLVPSGSFFLGSLEDEQKDLTDWAKLVDSPADSSDEQGMMIRIIKPYYMATTETTNKAFMNFIKETRYVTTAEKEMGGSGFYFYKENDKTKCAYMNYFWNPEKSKWGIFNDNTNSVEIKSNMKKTPFFWKDYGVNNDDSSFDTLPVVNVSYIDIAEFIKWMSKKDRKAYRIPNEVEWEYACRAGNQEMFSTGKNIISLHGHANVADASLNKDSIPEQIKAMLEVLGTPKKYIANEIDDRFPLIAPVKSFKPNRFGLYDMHGNVSEMCSNYYFKQYKDRLVEGESDPVLEFIPNDKKDRAYAVRGGSWLMHPYKCRSAFRDGDGIMYEKFTNFTIGFRLVCPVIE